MATLKRKTNNGYEPLPAMVVRKTNAENGNGIGTCSTSSGTALTVSLTGYELVTNGFIAVTFENDVPANATLNINGKGAKPIYYKGSAITADTIKADDTVMFAYDGTNYVVTSLGGESGGGSVAGLEIVAASGTTLTAEVGKYYRYDNEVSALAVTLPTVTGVTEVQDFILEFSTGSSISVTFTGGTIKDISCLSIKKNAFHVVRLTWDGTEWIANTEIQAKGHREVEYLESTGTQYIDTGLKAYGDSTRVEMTIGTITGSYWAFGTRTAFNDTQFVVCNGGTNGTKMNQAMWFYGNVYGAANITNNTAIHNISIIAGTAYFDSTSMTKTPTSFTTVSNMIMFGYREGNTITYGNMKIYSCKIYDGATLLRDFIPVKIGQVGYMYDKITDTYFGNSGSGSFVIGPDA